MNGLIDYVIHSRSGKLGDGVSSVADVTRLVDLATSQQPPSRGIVIHFHGGLVNKNAGLQIAQRLADEYSKAGAYPMFFVWEAGFLETIKNNLGDILGDKVFRELLKKAGEWVLREGAGAVATRGSGQAVDTNRLRDDFDRWLSGQSTEPPLRLDMPATAAVTRASEPDEDELATLIEAEFPLDEEFEATIAGLAVASGKTSPAATRGVGVEPAPVNVLVDQKAIDEMFPQQGGAVTRGGIPWWSVAKFIAKVAIASLKRFRRNRDHGPYVTVVEEVLRAAYVAKVGEVVWRQLKKDTADAFGDGTSVGTVFLEALAAQQANGRTLPSISLIGHSTGAVYINNFLAHAARILPGVTFNVLFLAPACRCEDFAATLKGYAGSIANFRMFAMHDALEQNDQLVPIIYPRSLLYFVSGVVEGEVDAPIVGMERFMTNTAVFDDASFPDIAAVRAFLTASNRSVWSLASGGSGLASQSTKHGDFDNDADTLSSLTAILRTGF
jgi:hypothetical protein